MFAVEHHIVVTQVVLGHGDSRGVFPINIRGVFRMNNRGVLPINIRGVCSNNSNRNRARGGVPGPNLSSCSYGLIKDMASMWAAL